MEKGFFDMHCLEACECYEPWEVLAIVRALKEEYMTGKQIVHIDVFLQNWMCIICFQRANDYESVLEIQTLCEIAQQLLDPKDTSYFHARWDTYHELLESLRRSLLKKDPELKRTRVNWCNQIFSVMPSEEKIKQSELGTALQHWSKRQFRTILGALESRGMIKRQKAGDDCWVSRPNEECRCEEK